MKLLLGPRLLLALVIEQFCAVRSPEYADITLVNGGFHLPSISCFSPLKNRKIFERKLTMVVPPAFSSQTVGKYQMRYGTQNILLSTCPLCLIQLWVHVFSDILILFAETFAWFFEENPE